MGMCACPPLSHLYVHVPFCNGACHYCAFYSVPCADPAGIAAWLGALDTEAEQAARAERFALETLYLGGGTPTVLADRSLERLLDVLRNRFDLSRLTEWSVEATPDTVTPSKAGLLRAAGVTRISLGAQAFDDAVLAAAGRRHRAADIPRAAALCRAAGIPELGLDLIAGLPGSDASAWDAALAQTLALAPEHVSVYALDLDPDAPWARAGCSPAPLAESVMARRLRRAEARLAAAGIRRYEISNYARAGRACRYNLAVWHGADYLGLGPAAASRRGRRRWRNRADLPGYTAALRAGHAPPRETETLDAAADLGERLAFAFRCADGIDLDAFVRRVGAPPRQAAAWAATLNTLCAQRLVTHAGARWRPTRRGMACADTVAAALL
jgi:oxygen-independent coproporphyrinogen III oxidase